MVIPIPVKLKIIKSTAINDNMKNEKVLSIINLLSFAFLMYASYLFRTNQSAFDKDLDPVFNPAPYTFSIWMVIFIALFLWIIKGFFAKHEIKHMYLKVFLLLLKAR